MQERLDRIRAAMAEADLDALFVGSAVDDVFGTHSANRRYLTGFSGSSGYAMVSRDAVVLATDFRYVEQAAQECGPLGVATWTTEGSLQDWWPRLLGELGLGGKRIGLSRADTTLGFYTRLWEAVGDMPAADAPQLVPAPPVLEDLREIKDEQEMAALQRAIDAGDRAMAAVTERLREGVTERQVSHAIQAAILEHGGEGISFETIVAAGAWGARPHATPRDVAIERGEPVVVDMGARIDGYCSDLTRTVVVGELDAEFAAIYDIVLAAQRNAIERVEAGMSGRAAHELAASVIADAGYGDAFGHGLGHGVGLDVHEAPYLGRTSEDTLEDGMVFTIEPGIYLPGRGGVRIEDVVRLEHGRARVLSHAPKLATRGVTP